MPASFPFHSAKCSTLVIGATMIGADSGPFVDGVQAIGIAVSASGRGVTMRALTETISQPRPNSNPSRRTFARPQPLNLSTAHFSARRIPGARLVGIPGMGHDLPPGVVTQLLSHLIPHLNGARA